LPGTFPVTWASFTATPTEGGSVSLRWETASELNNAFFEIERSSEKDFSVPQKLGETPGMGTSNVGARYVFPDQNFPRGLMYYRLRQVDIDGSFSYSNIISANVPASNFEAELGPSPATDACTLWLHAIPSTGYQLRVYDSMGKEVWYKNEQNPAASAQEIALPVQALPTGTYLLSIKTDEKEISRKLVVVRE
ncbi:MAG: T9SS type A sorting domain-containing protein, partial [Bacteroidia bacterium]